MLELQNNHSFKLFPCLFNLGTKIKQTYPTVYSCMFFTSTYSKISNMPFKMGLVGLISWVIFEWYFFFTDQHLFLLLFLITTINKKTDNKF